MSLIEKDRQDFISGRVAKPEFIKKMYDDWHKNLFEYAASIHQTNVKSIEIIDSDVIMMTRDRGLRFAAVELDRRIAPIAMLNFYDYEKDETQMIENLVGKGSCVLDVGANIGWYSINLAAARRDIKLCAFEPIPRTYETLQKNIKLNHLTNIQANNFGFSDKPGVFPFYYYPEGSGNASLSNLTGREDISSIECKLSTIDDYVQEENIKVDFIKCDVEGAELLVFRGGVMTIERDKPIVFSEILRKWSAKFDYNPNDIFEFFQSLGYRAFSVKGEKLKDFIKMDESTVETNFFFLHKEKHAQYIDLYAR